MFYYCVSGIFAFCTVLFLVPPLEASKDSI